jgi:muconate cycloisomerase
VTLPAWLGWWPSRRPGIVVDEGPTDRDSLQRFIAHRACTGANVRISKCGGLVGAHARCREVLDAGLLLQVGCQVGESSLLSAAHLALLEALAPVTPGVRYAEGCFGRHLLREDPVSPLVQFGYGGRPPPRARGAGLGVQVDQAMLERWAVDQAIVTLER